MPEKRRFMLCVCVCIQTKLLGRVYIHFSVFIAKIESKNDEK